MKKLLWGALPLLLLAGSARAQVPSAPININTGLAPHFHFDKGGIPFFGPYKGSTLEDLPGGKPRHPRPIPWWAYFPAHAAQQPTGPMNFPFWPTMPPAGNGGMVAPMPPDMGMGMQGMPPGMMMGQPYAAPMQPAPGMLPPAFQGGAVSGPTGIAPQSWHYPTMSMMPPVR